MNTNIEKQGEAAVKRHSLKVIKEVFPQAVASGIILPEVGQGLHVAFRQVVNLFDALNMKEPNLHMRHAPLFDLVQEFGFVVLRNCRVDGIADTPKSHLSHGQDFDGRFIQDPYHYDCTPHVADYMGVIYPSSDAGRTEGTYFAYEDDVKAAVKTLPKEDMDLDVVDALDDMARPDYHFRLYNPRENEARQTVKHHYPQFVDDVFKRIPEGRKFCQQWLTGVWDVVVHANIFGNMLHARPTGHVMASTEAPSNPLRGLYLYKE